MRNGWRFRPRCGLAPCRPPLPWRPPARDRWHRRRARAPGGSRAGRRLRATAAGRWWRRRTPRPRIDRRRRRARCRSPALRAIDLFLRRRRARRDTAARRTEQGGQDGASTRKYSRVWCTMKTVAPHDRPREKLQRLGAAALGDNELLAIVLGHGRAQRERARSGQRGARRGRRRARAGSRRGTTSCARIPGSARARAAQILAAVELGRRTLTRAARERVQIVTSPRDARRVPAAAVRQPRRSSSSASSCSTRSTACCGRSIVVGRHARRQHRPSARGVPRGGGSRRGRDRAVPQSSVGRSRAEPGRCRADAAAGGGRGADGHRCASITSSWPTCGTSASRKRERSERGETAVLRLLLRRVRRHDPRRAARSRACRSTALRGALGSLAIEYGEVAADRVTARGRLGHEVPAASKPRPPGRSGTPRHVTTRTITTTSTDSRPTSTHASSCITTR